MDDNEYMKIAYEEAEKANIRGEYPVGAVIVNADGLLAKAGNTVFREYDPTAHAEVLVIREACKKLQRITLEDCILYTTLYPCPICESSILEAGIKKVIYGATTFDWLRDVKFDKSKLEYKGPIMEEKCRGIFVSRLKEKGRTDILEYKKGWE
ncbi:nucleoside deaminase [Candidatus Riflebacteria bacterium]